MADINRIDKITSRRIQEKDPVFTDFYNNLTVHPQNKRLVLHTDEQSVKRSIRNILSTNATERFYNPKFGGGLRRFLFEDISEITAGLIKDSIKDSIDRYEPRARVIDVLVTGNEFNNSYEVTVYFEVINSPNAQNIQLTLYRVR